MRSNTKFLSLLFFLAHSVIRRNTTRYNFDSFLTSTRLETYFRLLRLFFIDRYLSLTFITFEVAMRKKYHRNSLN